MNGLYRILNSKKGASLVVVIVVLAIAVVLGSAILTIVSFSHEKSIQTHKQLQAYYTARSAMDVILRTLKDPATCGELSTKIYNSGAGTQFTGKGEISNMGKYEATFTKVNDKRIKVVVDATFKGEKSQIKAVLRPGKGNRFNPIEFALFNPVAGIDGMGGAAGDPIWINGDVYTNTGQSPYNVTVNGNYMTFGTFKLIAGYNNHINGNLYVHGDAELDIGNSIGGNVYHTKPLERNDNLRTPSQNIIDGNAEFVIGNLNHDSEGGTDLGYYAGVQSAFKKWTLNPVEFQDLAGIPIIRMMNIGYVKIGSTANPDALGVKFLNGWEFDFNTLKLLDHTGTNVVRTANPTDTNFNLGFGNEVNVVDRIITFENGTVVDFNNKKVILKQADGGAGYTEINIDYSISADYKNFTTSSGVTGKVDDFYIFPNGDVFKKSEFATATSVAGLTNSYNNHHSGKNAILDFAALDSTLKIDTTSGDIVLIVNNDLSIDGKNIEIIGNNKVYMYFGTSKTVTAKTGSVLGDNSTNQLYLIGENLTLDPQGSSVLKGTAYFDGGTYKESSATTGITKVEGSIVANSITVTRGNTYKYVEPSTPPAFDTTLPNNYYIYPKMDMDKINWLLDYYGD